MTAGVAAPADVLAALAADLRDVLAPDRVRTGATELGLYARDASNISGSAGVVCFPLTTAEVQACVRAAAQHGVDDVVETLRHGRPLSPFYCFLEAL